MRNPPPVKSGAPATRAGAYAGKFAHKKWTANAARQLAEKQPPFKGQKRELCMTSPLPWGKGSGRGFRAFHLEGKSMLICTVHSCLSLVGKVARPQAETDEVVPAAYTEFL